MKNIVQIGLLLAWFVIPIRQVLPQQSSSLPRSSAEAQGVSSSAIVEYLDAANAKIDSLHSFMLVRHGHVVAEGWWKPYDAATKHQLYSLSKSFTSTAVGLAIAEGKLSLDDEVVKFFPEDIPESPSEFLKAMRVRDLLTMSTGHDSEPAVYLETLWAKKFLAHPVKFKPGTHFLYNTPSTYMCSAIVQKQTGQTVLDYLEKRLFAPLGIDNPTWGTSPEGVSLGGYGLNVRTEDIAKFGQLYLQRGKWQGQQLIPADWVEMATSKQVPNGTDKNNDWNQGYGFQFWRARHNCYRGDGAFGQYCVVMPEQDAVIAITAGVKNMPAVLDLVWDKLLPGFAAQALPEDKVGADKLRQKLQSLELPMVAVQQSSKPALQWGDKKVAFEANDQLIQTVKLAVAPSGQTSLLLTVSDVEHNIPVGNQIWQRSKNDWGAKDAASPVFTNAAWTADNVCTVKICYVETPFVQTLRFEFDEQLVRLHSESNVAFGPTKKPTITGK